jgi:hypothetical protein
MSGMVVWYNPKPQPLLIALFTLVIPLIDHLRWRQTFRVATIPVRHGLFSFRVILRAATHNDFKFQSTCFFYLLIHQNGIILFENPLHALNPRVHADKDLSKF